MKAGDYIIAGIVIGLILYALSLPRHVEIPHFRATSYLREK